MSLVTWLKESAAGVDLVDLALGEGPVLESLGQLRSRRKLALAGRRVVTAGALVERDGGSGE